MSTSFERQGAARPSYRMDECGGGNAYRKVTNPLGLLKRGLKTLFPRGLLVGRGLNDSMSKTKKDGGKTNHLGLAAGYA